MVYLQLYDSCKKQKRETCSQLHYFCRLNPMMCCLLIIRISAEISIMQRNHLGIYIVHVNSLQCDKELKMFAKKSQRANILLKKKGGVFLNWGNSKA